MLNNSDVMISHFHCLVGFVLNSGRCSKGLIYLVLLFSRFLKWLLRLQGFGERETRSE